MNAPYKIVLCDDHAIVRQGLRALLAAQPDLEVVGEASCGDEVLALLDEIAPDLILLDLGMPGPGGIQVTERIRAAAPQVRVLILSMVEDVPVVRRALRAGAAGYVVKGAGLSRLVEAIETVRRGEQFLSEEVAEAGNDVWSPTSPSLTDREREILTLIAQGHTGPEIARRLNISPKTVGNHRTNIMQKLDLHDAAGLTRYAIREGLVVP